MSRRQEIVDDVKEGLEEYNERKAERAITLKVGIYRQNGSYFAIAEGREIAKTDTSLLDGDNSFTRKVNFNIQGRLIDDILRFAGDKYTKIRLMPARAQGKRPLSDSEFKNLEFVAGCVIRDMGSKIEIKAVYDGVR